MMAWGAGLYASARRTLSWARAAVSERLGHCRLLNVEGAPRGGLVGGSSETHALALEDLFARLLTAHGGRDGVRYAELRESALFQGEYQAWAGALPDLDLATVSPPTRKAFFINLYNMLTIHALSLEAHASVQKVIDIGGFWTRYGYQVGPSVFCADDMEHGILRGNRLHPTFKKMRFGEADPRLDFAEAEVDPRVHFALVCGAKSCPDLQSFSAGRLDSELDEAAAAFVNQTTSVTANQVTLSQILGWYAVDFGDNPAEVVTRIIPHASEGLAAELYRVVKAGKCRVEHSPYDWLVNRLPPPG